MSVFFLFAGMATVAISVFLRVFFNSPIAGLTDIIAFFCGLNAVLSWGYVEQEDGFVQVDFVKEYLPVVVQRICYVVVSIITIIALGFVAYRFVLYTIDTYVKETVTWVLYLPYYPIAFACFVGMLMYCLTFALRVVDNVRKWKEVQK